MSENIDWPAVLLADDSDASLLIWADWLEDQGDEAREGVREFLVKQRKRPDRALEARHGEPIKAGHIYICMPGLHLVVQLRFTIPNSCPGAVPTACAT